MRVLGRDGVFCASISAWRLVPSPEMRTASRRGDADAALGSCMLLFELDLRALYLQRVAHLDLADDPKNNF